MENKPRRESLVCGCCGETFTTWEGYQDQDQDEGYGICKHCQAKEKKRNADYYEQAFQQIYNAVNPDNKVKIDKKIKQIGKKYKIILVNIGIKKGRCTWEIGR